MEAGSKRIYRKMKRIAYTILALATCICMAASCQKETDIAPSLDPALVGEWHLIETFVEGEELDSDLMDVYLVLHGDCSFELYQKSGSQNDRYDMFTGTCTSQDSILTGVYSSGAEWGSSYTYKVTGSDLKLTSADRTEEQTYTKEALPEDIKTDTDTRAGEAVTPIL